MSGPPEQPDRRGASRVASSGAVFVHAYRQSVHGRIENLARGGIAITLDEDSTLLAGARVQLDVRLDGMGTWFRLYGCLARVDARSCVVRFEAVPADFEDLVQNELLAELECERKLHVLVVDSRPMRCNTITNAFRAAGCHVTMAGTPLEALSKLDESGLHVGLAAIANTTPSDIADDLRRHLRSLYPNTKIVNVEDVYSGPGLTAQVQLLIEARPS